MTITPAMLSNLRDDLNAALVEVARKHGLTSLRTGKATYSSGSFSMKIEGVAAGGRSAEAERYINSIGMLGLPPLGTCFSAGGVPYKITGINTTGSKLCVERLPDGKGFLYPTESAVALAKMQNPALRAAA